ncbi:unnamed protein product [Cylindrotheca closterium]|uniref:Uncharacterized protein n=1 Tax=Cylindrotheca closterium TaxID=2856 RepID=A0AAD2CFD8_9STRA|nr:unnamed protein product [Cylindrotheca closterium]
MEAFMSTLMRDYSATNFVIIRDDARIAEHQRAEFTTAVTASMEDTPKRPSFGNCPTKNPAPKLPSRRESTDDLFERKDGRRRTRNIPKRRSSMDDDLLLHGIKNIGNQPLSNLFEEQHNYGSPSRQMLFEDIFRDLDNLLKKTAMNE